MGLCTKRKIHLIFLVITVLQIITTGVRQMSDFLGPLWALILTNFFNLVFCIFGFFGAYTRRPFFVVMYIVWSALWTGWNIFIFCLYVPSLKLNIYKSAVLSVGTGGFSWWETRAPGCVSDWASESMLNVTNCYFDPNILEATQAGVQIYLAIWGIGTAISLLTCPYYNRDDNEKGDDRGSMRSSNSYVTPRTVPAFLSLSRSAGGGHNSMSRHGRGIHSRLGQRGPLSIPDAAVGGVSQKSTNGDLVNHSTIEDRLRPMTPRKVKRRSARSIQSSRFGPGSGGIGASGHTAGENSGVRTNEPHFSGSGSNRNSLRSNHSSKSKRSTNNHRSSKRKPNLSNTHQHFVSPVNRLMQQQLDSETSHDDPPYQRHRSDQGHVNPVYVGPQSPAITTNPNAPPRPPSARSSYSNYHPARLPINSQKPNPNGFNLNQTLFNNPAFDSSAEYNDSMLSNATNMGYYEDDMHFQPARGHLPQNIMPPVPMPGFGMSTVTPNNLMLHSSPTPLAKNFADLMSQQQKHSRRSDNLIPSNPTLVYPLAHSPISQESFPMWGIAQAQVPTQSPGIQSSSSSGYPQFNQSSRPYSNPPPRHHLQAHHLEINSETVI